MSNDSYADDRSSYTLFSVYSYNDDTNVGCLEQKPIPHIRASNILLCHLGWWFCGQRHLRTKCKMSAFHFSFPWVFLMLFFVVEPNPRTPYFGCYATWTDPIIFIAWTLLLFYDTGADCELSWQPGPVSLNVCALVMFVLMVIPALRTCELFPNADLSSQFLRDD